MAYSIVLLRAVAGSVRLRAVEVEVRLIRTAPLDDLILVTGSLEANPGLAEPRRRQKLVLGP